MKHGLLASLALAAAWNASYVAAVYWSRQRTLGRVLAVLGAAGAGFCVGLNAIWIGHDQRGYSASPSGYGGTFASLIADLIFIVAPLSLLGAGIGTWAGLRLSRDPSTRLPLAIGSAALSLASIAAVMSL